MKEYGKITLNLLVAATLAIVLAGALFSAIPILQQRVSGTIYNPGIEWSGGGAVVGGDNPPPEQSNLGASPLSDTSDGK